jgi:hypothetical protein
MTKLDSKTRRKINRKLGELGLVFHNSPGMALAAILDAMEPFGVSFDQMFQPKTGRTTNIVKVDGREVGNSLLVISTHEMEVTGRVELNTYLS